MKTFFSILGLLAVLMPVKGQFTSALTSLKISSSGFYLADISLAYVPWSEPKQIIELGSQKVGIPMQVNARVLKAELNRFGTHEGSVVTLEDSTYLPVHLYYDRETVDPTDDYFLLTLFFPVEPEVICQVYPPQMVQVADPVNFAEAPSGKVNYEIGRSD